MNESDLEQEMRALRPTPPHADLAGRILKELEKPPSGGFRITAAVERLLWVGVGAAAAVAVTQHLTPPAETGVAKAMTAHSTSVPLSRIQPAVQEEELAVADEGVRFVQAGAPFKKVRRTVLERQSWSDPNGGGLLEVQWPREEVIFVPVDQE